MSASTPAPLLVGTKEHRRSRAGARGGQPQQIDLFGDERRSALVTAPMARTAGGEQTTLTNLMARLILSTFREAEPDQRRRPAMISDKVRPHHLERKALLYVRQSSAHQVLHNRESSALQYAMRGRLMELGWSEIEIIDDDLGRSAAGGVQRAGFERMVEEVCLGKVGAVCARGLALRSQ